MQRVKVYKLLDSGTWEDRGTGHATVEQLQKGEAFGLVVISETDNQPLLVHRILPSDNFSLQNGESIITWTDADLGAEIALSFQDTSGCGYVWDQIVKYQAHVRRIKHSHGIDEYDQMQRNADGNQEFLQRHPVQQASRLPEPSTSNLEEIEEIIRQTSLFTREGLLVQLIHQGYLRKVLNIFRDVEDLEDKDRLKNLHQIVQNLFLLNDTSLIEALLCEENIMDVMGALEYDPSVSLKPDHRTFLREKVVFKEVVPIKDASVKAKIHQAYHIGYIKDVVLPRVLDDATFGTLSSMMLFNNMDVIVALHNDEHFVHTLFEKLRCLENSSSEWLDLAGFLRELCGLARHLQANYRSAMFNKLIQCGIFSCLGELLESSREQARQHGLDILQSLMQHDPLVLKTVLLDQKHNKLFTVLIGGLSSISEDSGIAWQVLEIVKLLLDPESSENKEDQNRFLDYFYQTYLGNLTEVLVDGQAETENALLIMDLLCFCVQFHSIRAQYFVLQNNVFDKVLGLLSRRDKVLPVAAIRFVRTCVGLKEKFYISNIINRHILDPVVEAFQMNGCRYNLLNSAFLELLEFIKHENIAPLLTFIVEKYDSVLELIDYVDTYKHFKARDRENKDTAASNRHTQTTLHEWKWDRKAGMAQDPDEQQPSQDQSFDQKAANMGEADSRRDGVGPVSLRCEGHNLKISMLPRPCLNCGLDNYKEDSDEEDEPASDLCHAARDKRCVGQVEVPVSDMGKKPRKDVEL